MGSKALIRPYCTDLRISNVQDGRLIMSYHRAEDIIIFLFCECPNSSRTPEDRIVCNDSLELRKLTRRFPSKTRHPFQVLQAAYFCFISFKLHSKSLLYEKVKKYFLSYKPSLPLNMSRTCSFGSGSVYTGRCNYCTVFRVRLMC